MNPATNPERRQILDMLAQGKITADEAERLLGALETVPSAPGAEDAPARRARYLRVLVDTDQNGRNTRVNVRVPMALLRAGVRLSGLVPEEARERANAAMREKGIAFDLNQLKPDNLDALIDQLNELTVDVDDEQAKVRVFAE